ncbi:MAG TPA: phosphate signaling complex protein PhoU [Termitinemataceae bacterium]|jgi:phosphate transport system protein|uniref:phosphate signaling complex protein PhoU n=1 Tax=Treponema sp. J25 TaxID=2094121 RepID=UPI0010532BBC|nr:phosphate signaling complex protein PhoU [Treponema sp. J25]TCW62370.1 phosphate transport system regulatory protein PhoU [Treponema sp. J25]HOJ98698.1 phosphate signaling complex protein PhoU [Termitinemataceae bacterium]HOM24157.1 phosphate signaling complex protein PhoU [Termitinemataceae bacterium]HPQ01178.1 phosphate signaling complex protein PhoU [Termitinemataceae bacterium]
MTGRIHLEEAKRQIQDQLLHMGVKVKDDLLKAAQALKEMDLPLAQEVKDDDPEVNKLQIEIEETCARVIATQQPVAQDMRWLLSCIKIANELERIGDYAVHLAKTVLKLEKQSSLAATEQLFTMAHIGSTMVEAAIEAFIAMDMEKAKNIAQKDDEIDQLHKELVANVIEIIQKHPEKISSGNRLIQTSGYLERLGDHVTNICEIIVYCGTGDRVELND